MPLLIGNVPTYTDLQEYLSTPVQYAAVLSPAAIELISKNNSLLYGNC